MSNSLSLQGALAFGGAASPISATKPLAQTMDNILVVRDLTVRLESGPHPVELVRSLSFSLRRGQTLCLVGESGCGKSLTALSILRLLPEGCRARAASVELGGQNLMALSERDLRRLRGRRVGMVFQEPMTSLNPLMRVGDQVAEPLRHHLGLSRREALARAEELFRAVGIPAPETRLRDYPHQLSGGMRQRVMIATALACEPELLLADEPTTALDVTIQGQILALLRDLTTRRHMGLLLITHDLGVVAQMADEVCVMYAGEIVEQAPVEDLLREPLHPYTKGLMRSAPTLEHLLPSPDGERPPRLDAIPGTVPAPDKIPSGCAFRTRCPLAHERCAMQPPEYRFLQPRPRRVRCWLHAPARDIRQPV